MHVVHIRVLGQVEAIGGAGDVVQIGSRNQRVVLAVLVAAGGDTVSVDRLIDAVWGDDPPRTAVHSVRTYVSRLRRLLGEAITIRPAGYALALDPDHVDATRFERLAHEAAATTGPESVGIFDQALELWRGSPFGDVADVESLAGPAIRLHELHEAAREGRARALLAAGQPVDAIATAEELVAEQPLREGAWVVLVEALARADRAADALRAYQRAVRALADAGLDPSSRLRDAEALALAAPAVAPRTAVGGRRLPTPVTSLVGRDGDLVQLDRLMTSARLVTLTGPGGVGKTRLAIEAARRVAERRGWEARLVDLAAIDDPASVAPAAADALGLTVESETATDALARAGGLEVLVVLDNCEHVIDEAAGVAAAIVTGGERARVLATSRERFAIDGEHIWVVAPLPMTDPDAPAQQLLIDRVRALRPTLTISDSDREALDRIVRRLDGLPLAIEMAAGRAGTLPVREIADRLDSRLDLLHEAQRSRAARHRTLAAVVEWSETLLDEDDRALFTDLGVFAGPVAADDVAAITGRPDALEALCHLADRSLVVTGPLNDRVGFGMLGTVREHARARLHTSGRAHGLARRHAEHFTAAAVAADAELRTSLEPRAAQRLEELLPDLRAAHAWAREHNLGLAVRLSAALHLFAQSRIQGELLQWATRIAADLPAEGVPREAVAVTLASAAFHAVSGGDLSRARALAERGVEIAGDAPECAYPLELVGDIHLYEGRLDEAQATAREILRVSEAAADPHIAVLGIVGLSLPEAYEGRYAAAERRLADPRTEGVELSPSDRAWLAYAEGEVVLDRDPARALAALATAIDLTSAVGNRYVGGVALVSDCSLRARAGDVTQALEAFASAIGHWRRCGAAIQQLTTLRNLVVLLQRLGAGLEVAELLGAVRRPELSPTYGDEAARLDTAAAWVRSVLGDAAAQGHIERGGCRSLDEAALVALEWIKRLRASSGDGAESA
jgi:predicted ATPase/DNA-binding SARP family transcriptional activator